MAPVSGELHPVGGWEEVILFSQIFLNYKSCEEFSLFENIPLKYFFALILHATVTIISEF